VICHNYSRHTFLGDIFGPKETWLEPGYEAAEWGFILYLFKTRSITRIIRLSISTLGSVLVPPLGFVLYTRFLLSLHASEKVFSTHPLNTAKRKKEKKKKRKKEKKKKRKKEKKKKRKKRKIVPLHSPLTSPHRPAHSIPSGKEYH
jgi:hypothetical protein